MPADARILSWARQTLQALKEQDDVPAEITIRIVSEAEMADLNGRFRGKPEPTNVLSFPAGVKDEEEFMILGDVVLCADLVAKEAEQQHKSVEAHFAHMIVHGVLHLKGYDHIKECQAKEMEDLELNIMNHLGFPDPWQGGNGPK